VATADQLKSLVKAHIDQDNDKFKTVVLQIAAAKARQGHTTIARELKDLLEKSSARKGKILNFNSQNQLLLMSMPNHKMSELIVSDEIRERIERVLIEFRSRKKLGQYGMRNRRKILIEGNPGTGKTLTASIIASELGLPLFTIQMDKLVTKFMGETSVKLRQIFDSIESVTGVYLFDEFDAIGADRSMDNEVGEMRRVLNSFLQFIEQDESESIIIAATNNQKILDMALFRRFDDVLHYSLPTAAELEMLFKSKLELFSTAFFVSDELLEKAASLSHAEITRICDDAIKSAILSDSDIISNEYLIRIIDERLAVYQRRA